MCPLKVSISVESEDPQESPRWNTHTLESAETGTMWQSAENKRTSTPRVYGQVCVCVQERRNLEMNEFSRGGKLSAARGF